MQKQGADPMGRVDPMRRADPMGRVGHIGRGRPVGPFVGYAFVSLCKSFLPYCESLFPVLLLKLNGNFWILLRKIQGAEHIFGERTS
jgi:hypothetical protein